MRPQVIVRREGLVSWGQDAPIPRIVDFYAPLAEDTIHRFEITIELFWKTLKRAIRYEGTRVETSRESLKEASDLPPEISTS